MKVDITKLRTVANYAKYYYKNGDGVSVQYIYKLINKKKLSAIKIDKVVFIHI